jgi:glutathione S-transferase
LTIRFYDLAGADPAHRFSPYCWRTRLALAHKGLAYEAIPWRFTDRAAIAFSGQRTVPVLVDGETVVTDSAAIADYLEAQYPDRPSLFGGDAGRALTRFAADWTEQVVFPGIARSVVHEIWQHLAPEDQAYFRDSRETRFGMTLEAVTAEREARLPAFRQALAPLRKTVEAQPFLGGTAPRYADYVVFGAFQWGRMVSRFELLAADDPIWLWRERVLDLYGGLARQAPCYPK